MINLIEASPDSRPAVAAYLVDDSSLPHYAPADFWRAVECVAIAAPDGGYLSSADGIDLAQYAVFSTEDAETDAIVKTDQPGVIPENILQSYSSLVAVYGKIAQSYGVQLDREVATGLLEPADALRFKDAFKAVRDGGQPHIWNSRGYEASLSDGRFIVFPNAIHAEDDPDVFADFFGSESDDMEVVHELGKRVTHWLLQKPVHYDTTDGRCCGSSERIHTSVGYINGDGDYVPVASILDDTHPARQNKTMH